MSQIDNLKPPQSTDEARKRGSKGGKASGMSRRAKRDARETARLFLDMPAADILDKNLSGLNIKKTDRTNLMAIIAKLVLASQSSSNQSINAARLVMEIAGYMPKAGQDNNFNVNIGKRDNDKIVVYLPEKEELE